MPTLATVACIKWGTLFGPEYVNRLYSGVRRNLSCPVRFVCMTEHAEGLHPDIEVLDLPVEPFAEPMAAALKVANRQGAMRKVSLFLDDLLTLAPGHVVMRHDWTEARKGRPTGHGSVFRYDPAVHGFLYDDLAADAYREVEVARGSEQRYTSHKAMDREVFTYIPGDWVVSFKYDCNPFPGNYLRAAQLPAEARVVCFHGRPKMPEAIEGYRGSLIRYAKPTAWLQEHWVDLAKADLGDRWG